MNTIKSKKFKVKFNGAIRDPTFYEFINFDGFGKIPEAVTPAKAGVQKILKRLDNAAEPA